jgi:hypothetical protein
MLIELLTYYVLDSVLDIPFQHSFLLCEHKIKQEHLFPVGVDFFL